MKKNIKKITIKEYIKAVKKADREIQLEINPGWTAINKIHKSKKIYNRKNKKQDYQQDE